MPRDPVERPLPHHRYADRHVHTPAVRFPPQPFPKKIPGMPLTLNPSVRCRFCRDEKRVVRESLHCHCSHGLGLLLAPVGAGGAWPLSRWHVCGPCGRAPVLSRAEHRVPRACLLPRRLSHAGLHVRLCLCRAERWRPAAQPSWALDRRGACPFRGGVPPWQWAYHRKPTVGRRSRRGGSTQHNDAHHRRDDLCGLRRAGPTDIGNRSRCQRRLRPLPSGARCHHEGCHLAPAHEHVRKAVERWATG